MLQQLRQVFPDAVLLLQLPDQPALYIKLVDNAFSDTQQFHVATSAPTGPVLFRTTPFNGQELHPRAIVRGPLHFMGGAVVVKVVDMQSNFIFDIPLAQVLPSLEVEKSQPDRTAGVRAGGETGPSERTRETLGDPPSAFSQHPIFA